jgi:hypothetical protein
MDNIFAFPCRELDPVQIEISLGSVDQAKRELECLSAVLQVAEALCEKPVSDELILAGIRRLFDAHAAVVKRARRLVPACEFPRFDRGPPGAA